MRRPRPVVVVMARAPRLGAGKRRLAAAVGAVEAVRFHRVNTAAVLRRLAADSRWRLVLAVTPDGAPLPRDWPPVTRIDQGGGDLGARMRRLLARFAPAPVVVVGSDIPALAPGALAAAFRALRAADVVFGPAEDGGFWLVGLRGRPRALPRLFRGVRWSGPHALADALAGLPAATRVGRAPRLWDVDTAPDYRCWRQRRFSANWTSRAR